MITVFQNYHLILFPTLPTMNNYCKAKFNGTRFEQLFIKIYQPIAYSKYEREQFALLQVYACNCKAYEVQHRTLNKIFID